MKKKNVILIAIAVVLLTPLWMWMAWWLTPKKKLVVAIVDKTTSDSRRQEHVSLDWVLNQRRYTKNSSSGYTPAHDYFGFFPGKDYHYRLKGLERFDSTDLDRLSGDADMVYFTDTYGVYTAEWYGKIPLGERSGILYGGMSAQDIGLLRKLKAHHKLAIAEFNSIGSPTEEGVRHDFESLYGVKWTGWTARYFVSLDTLKNQDLPRWLITQYKAQHGGRWPFHLDGIAWVDNAGTIVVTEDSTDLTSPVPHIETTAKGQEELGLPAAINYPFWFDVLEPDSSTQVNEAIADFVIPVNQRGKALLAANHIPVRFPAIVRHTGDDYGFYYFSGDFCDNPISFRSSYFKGISFFKGFFYDPQEPGERGSFFWNFYRPMMSHILDGAYRAKDSVFR